MTIAEIIFLVLAIAAGYVAYQAKHNGVTFAAQAKTDVADAKAEATQLAHDLELRVVALETKFGLIKATPAAPPAAAAAAPIPRASS